MFLNRAAGTDGCSTSLQSSHIGSEPGLSFSCILEPGAGGGVLIYCNTEMPGKIGFMASAPRILTIAPGFGSENKSTRHLQFTYYVERPVHEYQIDLFRQASVNIDAIGLTGTRYSTRLHGRSGPISLSEFNTTPTSSRKTFAVDQ